MGTLQVSHGPTPASRQRAFHAFPAQRELELAAARQAVIAEAAALVAAAPRPQQAAAWQQHPEPPPGRVLAAAVRADRNWPPFARAMRDGYAVRARDAASPAALPCQGEVGAGEPAPPLAAGACLAIMTGAPVPAGADCVVMIENTRQSPGGRVSVDVPPHPGDNIAPPGSDAAAGAVVAAAGRRLTPTVVAVLAQAGCLSPQVFAAPRVAILATGDELVPPEHTPGPTQIRNSNGPMLAALAQRAGVDLVSLGQVDDDAGALRAALDAAMARAEIVICSGGASVGAHDLIKPAFAALGAELRFDAVAMRPGHPQVFARCGQHLLFGLPGNPLGALLGFLLLVRPALEVCAGLEAAALPPWTSPAVLDFDYSGKALALVAFRPVRYAAGSARLQEIPYRGSADLAAAAAADAWMAIPPGVTRLPAGSAVEVVPA